MKRALVNKLRRDWKRQGKSQNQVARDLGISHAHLSGLLNGDRTPSLRLAAKLAEVGIPVTEFLSAS